MLTRFKPDMQLALYPSQEDVVNRVVFARTSQNAAGFLLEFMMPDKKGLTTGIMAAAILVAYETGKTVTCFIKSDGNYYADIAKLRHISWAMPINTMRVDDSYICIEDKDKSPVFICLEKIERVANYAGITNRLYLVDGREVIRDEHRHHLYELAMQENVYIIN